MKHSNYTKALAEKGDLLTHEDKDRTVLSMMKLRYVLETNFTILHPWEKPTERRHDLIHTTRTIFPVVDDAGKLLGIIYSERLFEILLGEPNEADKPIADFVQKQVDTVQMCDTREGGRHKEQKSEVQGKRVK